MSRRVNDAHEERAICLGTDTVESLRTKFEWRVSWLGRDGIAIGKESLDRAGHAERQMATVEMLVHGQFIAGFIGAIDDVAAVAVVEGGDDANHSFCVPVDLAADGAGGAT